MPEVPALKVFIGSDHRGYDLKRRLVEAFPNFIDLGPASLDPNDDYNDAAVAVSKAVLENPNSFGVLICGSAIGISIQANRFKGIRAALAYSKETVKLSREHNNANILCISADEIKNLENTTDSASVFSELGSALQIFFNTPFSAEERHVRRVKKLDFDYNLEEK